MRTQLAIVIASLRCARGIIYKSRLTPGAEKRGQLHTVGEQPAEEDHQGDPVFLVYAGVEAVVGDHDVPCGIISNKHFHTSIIHVDRSLGGLLSFDQQTYTHNLNFKVLNKLNFI